MTESNPENRRLGFARVSTYGQTLDAQLAQLRAEGRARIYREKASGAQPTRRELLRMLKALGPGDVVTVTRIDRLARSTEPITKRVQSRCLPVLTRTRVLESLGQLIPRRYARVQGTTMLRPCAVL